MSLLGIRTAGSVTYRNGRRQVLESLVNRKVQLRVEEATATLNSIGEVEHRIDELQWSACPRYLLFKMSSAIR